MTATATVKFSGIDVTKGAFDSVLANVQGLKGAFGSFQGILAGLGATLGVGAFAALIKSTIDAQGELNDLATQTGATVEGLSRLKEIARITGTDFGIVTGSLEKLDKSMSMALAGSGNQARAFQALGLSATDAAGNLKKPDAMLEEIAGALDNFKDGAGKTAIAMALFGKEGAKLLPMLSDMADNVDVVHKVTKEQAKAADDLGDSWRRLQAIGGGTRDAIVGAIVPALLELVKALNLTMTQAGGTSSTLKELAADGSITSWARAVVNALTYVLDVFEILWRAVRTTGDVFAAVFALIHTQLEMFAGVVFKLMKGDFIGAFKESAAAVRRDGSIIKDAWADVTKSFTDPTFGSKLRANIDVIRAGGAEAAKATRDLNFALKEGKDERDTALDAFRNKLSDLIRLLEAGNPAQKEYQERVDLLGEALERQELPLERIVELEAKLFEMSPQRIAQKKAEAEAAMLLAKSYDHEVQALVDSEAVKKRTEQAALDAIADMAKQADALDRETKLIGLNARARAELTAVMAIEEAKRKQNGDPAGIAALDAILDRMRAAINLQHDLNDAIAAEVAMRSNTDYAHQALVDVQRQIDEVQREVDLYGKANIEHERANVLRTVEAAIAKDIANNEGRDVDLIRQKGAELMKLVEQRDLLDKQTTRFRDMFETAWGFARDFFTRWQEEGWGGAIKYAKDRLKREFFDWLITQAAKPIILNFVAQMTGAGGNAVQAMMAQGTQGNIFSQFLGNPGSSGIGNLVSTGANMLFANSMPSWIGDGSQTLFGMGGATSGIGGAVGGFGMGSLIGWGAARLFGNERNASNIQTGAQIGGMIGSFIPVIGTIIGSLIGAAIGSLIKSGGGPKEGGFASFQPWGGRPFYTETQANETLQKLTQTIGQGYESLVTTLGGTRRNFQFAIGYDTDPEGTSPTRMGAMAAVDDQVLFEIVNRELGRDTSRLQGELSRTAKQALLMALQASDMPQRIADILNSVDALDSNEAAIDAVIELAGAVRSVELASQSTLYPLQQFENTMRILEGGPLAQLGVLRGQVEIAAIAFDGTASSAQALTQATLAYGQAAQQVLAQIYAARQSVGQTAEDTTRNMRLGTMTPQEQYSFYDDEIANWLQGLTSMNDPTRIQSGAQRMIEDVEAAFNLLDPEQQRARLGEFLERINELNEETQARLAKLSGEVDSDALSLDERIQTAIVQGMEIAAGRIEAAANTMQQAATDIEETEVNVNVNFNANVPGQTQVYVVSDSGGDAGPSGDTGDPGSGASDY